MSTTGDYAAEVKETRQLRTEEERKLTEKAREYKENELTTKFNKLCKAYSFKTSNVEAGPKGYVSATELLEMRVCICEDFNEIEAIYDQLTKVSNTAPPRDTTRRIDQLKADRDMLMTEIRRRMDFNANHASCPSRRSQRSRQSSTSSMMRATEANIAAHKAEIEAHQEEALKVEEVQLLELEMSRKKQELEKQRLTKMLRVEEARAKVYRDSLEQEESKSKLFVKPSEMMGQRDGDVAEHHKSSLNAEAHHFAPPAARGAAKNVEVPHSTQQVTDESATTAINLLAAMTLPQPEVPKFRGELTEYMSFMNAFDSRVGSRVPANADKLFYLNQYLVGEPKDVIEGCIYMNSDQGYVEARRLLDVEYGDPYKISMVYMNKLQEWPVVKQDDNVGLKQFSLYITKCGIAMGSMSYLTVLDHPPNMLNVVRKLPFYLQNKWREYVSKARQRYQKVLLYQDLVEFVRSAAETANDPVYGRDAMSKSDGNRGNTDGSKSKQHVGQLNKGKPKSTSFATNVSTNSSDNRARLCPLCDRQHGLDDCKEFCSQSNDAKRAFLKENRLCFACYGTDHMSRGCVHKRKCRICGKPHPTALHVDGFRFVRKASDDNSPTVHANHDHGVTNEQNYANASHNVPHTTTCHNAQSVPNSSCTATDVNNSVILHAILPVKIHQKGSDNVITTYAFYDSGSSGCFLTEDLLDSLHATGMDTRLQLRTMHGCSCIDSKVVNDLVVTDIHGDNPIEMPRTYTRNAIPVNAQQIPKPEMVRKWEHLQSVADEMPAYRPELDIGILIGSNCPSALEPIEVVPMTGGGPFATRLRHGWTIYGPLVVTNCNTVDITSNRIMIQEIEEFKETMSPTSMLRMFELDFNDYKVESYPDERGMSQEDVKFMQKAEEHITFSEGHYTIPLPFRDEDIDMPDNRDSVLKRALYQKKKMLKDDKYRADYTGFIDKILDQGYAQKVPDEQLTTRAGKVWYLPHHGVYNPNKPGKIRVVFDCSATFKGTSLNDKLLQGPDLTNNLVGVLTRFRLEPVAFMADIESMFYQVKVPEEQWDFLRFWWWPNGDLDADPQEYQMNVHLFGAVSSPSCANFALRKTGDATSNAMVSKTIHRNFYVDDCLKSVETREVAETHVEEVQRACAAGGFNLTKWISNSHSVMKSIPKKHHSKEMSKRDLDYDDLPVERALGVQWSVETDQFGFSIITKNKPLTRRGILSVVSSVYDPLGFVAPVILPAKKILQDLCREPHLGWDDNVPEEYLSRWHSWLTTLPSLEKLTINRCLKPKDFDVVSKELHVFSDASTTGYGSVAYLRLRSKENQYHIAFLVGKARLAPLKPTTIPRLELTAAVTSVRLAQMMKREMDEELDVTYHTDSTTVLRYIANEQRKFPVYVTNRVQVIRDFSRPDQWRYVASKLNPADEASRGLTAQKMLQDSQWLKGPEFLKADENAWDNDKPMDVDESYDEESTIDVNVTAPDESVDVVSKLIEYFSDWYRLRVAVAVFLKVRKILQNKVALRQQSDLHIPAFKPQLRVQDIDDAETSIMKWLHAHAFPEDVLQLSTKTQVLRSSVLRSLDPFLDDGVLRVGGRLSRTTLPDQTKHPVILPRKSHVTSLIIRHEHRQLGHAGRNHVLSNLRERYWIIGGNAAVRQVITQCVMCRRSRNPPQEQKMADLPRHRVDDTLPPFSYTGVDYFGPFLIREGRKEVKRYGALFTCLVSRAVHIEIANSLDTDSFIHALRRFSARRGNVKEMHSDNGTNFVGAEKELKAAVKEMDHDSIQRHLQRVGINWIFNPPSASHMGGVWERMIRTVRKVLTGLLLEYGSRLDGESFHTLLCEVEAIINSRPLTSISGDINDLEPLTPNHLLTGRSMVTAAPPGVFQRNDVYMRRRWRRVQYLTNLFWSRWKKEYLILLQQRQKWSTPTRNMKPGDIVLIKDDNLPRNLWSLGRVTDVEADKKGFVRAVKVKTQQSQLRRPVNKLVLLLPNDV